jgi:hypothetical protein
LSIRRQISQSILDRLKRGQHDGDVPKTAPIVALTAYYSTVLHGLALQSREERFGEYSQLVTEALIDRVPSVSSPTLPFAGPSPKFE